VTIGIPLPLPAWGHGTAASFEEAKAAFRKAWDRFYPSLTRERVAH
jgi:hypothetical protein